jgi:hypothetical protein
MDWSDEDPPYPSALPGRPVRPLPGTAWRMVAAIAWVELKDCARDLRDRVRYWLMTSSDERAAARYRAMLEVPLSAQARKRAAERFPLTGDIHMPWALPPGDTSKTRLQRFLEPPPEEDSFW